MLKFLIIVTFGAGIAWFFYQGITGQPYSIPPFRMLFLMLKFW